MKWLTSGAFAGVMITALVMFGCARCPTAEKHSDLAEGIYLPKGFAVMKGLAETDFDEYHWPKYIVSTKDGSIMTLVSVPRQVTIGSPKEVNESPPHRVTIERFYIDLYEVNNAQFDRFAKALGCPLTKKDSPCLMHDLLSSETSRCWCKRNWKPMFAGCLKSHPCKTDTYVQLDREYFKEYWTPGVNDSHPARAVSFWEAWYYCRWVGKDLPTEAEWELAAKGTSDRLYPWGNIEPDSQNVFCNYGGSKPEEDGYEYTAPVSAFAKGRSPFGAYNMSGNVWEWCKDNYDATIYSVADFARGKDKKSELDRQMTNPKGPAFGDARVIRGGAFTSNIYNCRTTARQASRPNFHGMNIGFRGVLRIR